MQHTTDITTIAFAPINADYSWGHYGGFKVIMYMPTGYINAAHLCGLALAETGVKKEFSGWKRTDFAQELMQHMASSLRLSRDALIMQPTEVPNELRGTYVHWDLIPHVAAWISPSFAWNVSRIVNAHVTREAAALIAK